MPCFKGLAVSVHTPNGPLPEYSIQKQSRLNRISSYIPVPAPKFTPGSDRPEQSSFAISITLLTPGSHVPYSRPDPTAEEPHPSPKVVGGLPGSQQRGKYSTVVGPYIPLTQSPFETVAAYIHFDGRAKEEVATLLRRGVETWVNSRWVGVPAEEGGGLAEREFLFREVGLERWLNGLDLEGESKDVAARIERRRQRLEKKRRKKLDLKDSDDEDIKVEDVSGDEATMSTSDDSDDEMPDPEATGQIKVSLFRVMASGEIKKGEYSPSFDAHDDDDETTRDHNGDNPGVDHTTTFAKPKTLDPKSISTQTVTGIDDPRRPYATFTFFYRGERQLQKMGIIPTTDVPDTKKTTSKRKSRQLDFSKLGPLKKEGAVGFAGYRDAAAKSSVPNYKNGKRNEDDMDSDVDDETGASSSRKESTSNGVSKAANDREEPEDDTKLELSAEELSKRAELAEGVKKIQLKRQHSFDKSAGKAKEASAPFGDADPGTASLDKSPPPSASGLNASGPLSAAGSRLSEQEAVSSPFKKQRASVSAVDGKKLFSSQLSASSTHFSPGPSPDAGFGGSSPTKSSQGTVKKDVDVGPEPKDERPPSKDAAKLAQDQPAGSTATGSTAAAAMEDEEL